MGENWKNSIPIWIKVKFTYRTQSSVRVKGTKSHSEKSRTRHWLSPKVRFFISYQSTFDIFICESAWFFEILFLFTEEVLCPNWNVNVVKLPIFSLCNLHLNLGHLFYHCCTIVQLYNSTTEMRTFRKRTKNQIFSSMIHFDLTIKKLTAFISWEKSKKSDYIVFMSCEKSDKYCYKYFSIKPT